MIYYKRLSKEWLLLLIVTMCLLLHACQQPIKSAKKPLPTFKKVWGIGYTEVHRYFPSGYAFNDKGYQLYPEWRLSFVSDDSVNIYHPGRKMFVNSPVFLDHDSVFNIAWAYLRLKKLDKDSIVFQVLRVRGKAIDNDGSNVYMKLYANNYIKNTFHKQPLAMQAATSADSLFIRRKAEQARLNPAKAFAATQIAQLISRSPMVTVKRVINDDRADTGTDGPKIDYLSPEYNITIRKAYDDFYYYFTIYVDQDGQISFGKPMDALMPEFAVSYPRIMKAIVKGYLKAYLTIKPGTTLGIPHTSEVIVAVTGTKH